MGRHEKPTDDPAVRAFLRFVKACPEDAWREYLDGMETATRPPLSQEEAEAIHEASRGLMNALVALCEWRTRDGLPHHVEKLEEQLADDPALLLRLQGEDEEKLAEVHRRRHRFKNVNKGCNRFLDGPDGTVAALDLPGWGPDITLAQALPLPPIADVRAEGLVYNAFPFGLFEYAAALFTMQAIRRRWEIKACAVREWETKTYGNPECRGFVIEHEKRSEPRPRHCDAGCGKRAYVLRNYGDDDEARRKDDREYMRDYRAKNKRDRQREILDESPLSDRELEPLVEPVNQGKYSDGELRRELWELERRLLLGQ